MTAGAIPSLTSVNPKSAVSTATTASQQEMRPIPPPRQAPLTRATVGIGSSSSARSIAAKRPASASFSSREKRTLRRIQFMSAPAQKAVPSPVTTRARGPPSGAASNERAIPASACSISAIRRSSNAFRTSGRASVIRATGPPGSRRIRDTVLLLLSSARRAWTRRRLHPVDGRRSSRHGGVQGGRERERDHRTRLHGIDDTVVPVVRGRVVGASFALVLLEHRIGDRGGLLLRQSLPLPRQLLALDLDEHRRRLLGPHHRDPRVGPGEKEPWAVAAAAHGVVPGAVGGSDEKRQARHLGRGDGLDHLRAVLRDPARFVALPDHEPGDVLEEEERNPPLVAEL